MELSVVLRVCLHCVGERMSGPVMSSETIDADRVLPLASGSTALLLDIDGTLLDFAPTPREVWASPELLHTLRALHIGLGGAVAFVSGRVVSDIDLIFSPLVLPAVGGHGAELRVDISTDRGVAPPPLPGPIKRDFAVIGKLGKGILVEDKGYALALHYRLAPELGPKVIATAQTIQERLPDGAVELILGKFVVEVKPAGLTKATGVEFLMSQKPFLGRQPIFIGDDVTDETVFPIMPLYRGLGYSVGRRIAGTDGCFDDPHAVRSWLARAAQGLTERNDFSDATAAAYQQ